MMEILNNLAKGIGYAFLLAALAFAVAMCIAALDEFWRHWRNR